MYLGIKGAREILKILSVKLKMKLKLEKLDKEIKEIELEMKKTEEFASVSMGSQKDKVVKLQDYIG
jgi:proteasome assembly chaperone (PAC2) family protein